MPINDNNKRPLSTSESEDNNTPNKNKQDSKRRNVEDILETEAEMSELTEVKSVLAEIQETLKAVATKTDIMLMDSKMDGIVEALNRKVEVLESRIFDVEKERDEMKTQLQRMKEERREMEKKIVESKRDTNNIREELNHLQQYSRNFNLRIYKVPEKKGGEEDCAKMAIEVCKEVGVDVDVKDIENAIKLSKQNKRESLNEQIIINILHIEYVVTFFLGA